MNERMHSIRKGSFTNQLLSSCGEILLIPPSSQDPDVQKLEEKRTLLKLRCILRNLVRASLNLLHDALGCWLKLPRCRYSSGSMLEGLNYWDTVPRYEHFSLNTMFGALPVETGGAYLKGG